MTAAGAERRAAAGFRAVYGGAPDGIWAAPGRVNLIGEHTDYNEGLVLPLALEQRTLVAAAARRDGLLRLYSARLGGEVISLRVAELAPGAVKGWAAYPAGVCWALREAGVTAAAGGADVFVESEVPLGAGLSSSAALEVATALALGGSPLSGPELALLAQRAENEFVGVPCGVMDQMAAACCTAGHALLLDTRDLGMRQVPLELAGLRLLVVDTGVRHALADGAYAERRAGCAKAARALGVRALRDITPAQLPAALGALTPGLRPLVRHVVTENQRVAETAALLEAGEVREAGPLLTAGHHSLRDDFAVSCPELDLVVATAGAAGALGARMTGGGFGGSAVVLVAEARAAAVGRAVDEAFRNAGYGAPRVFTVGAGSGAGRVG
ncbi:galactokinase [Streptomyces orinoci]|uniref:Galactokinase n=1 Tax=Streptomyces orinoci TaxID=67339 RepID=A0ABV3K7U3_STRON|nr:galactokinase [Streptomyces orinoci]